MNKQYFCLLALLLPWTAHAVDLAWSGFATAGLTLSDQAYKYQRFIDDKVRFDRDSVLGGQLDLKFSPQWGVTVQGKVAPSLKSDEHWDATMSWAFVSWRPLDDWLIRAGKLRLPLMLNTENADVGATYDQVRLPAEVYSIAPTTDVVGLSVSKTWLADSFDWTLEAYTGKMKAYWRYYGREQTADQASPGSWYLPINIKSSGLVMTAHSIDNTFRIGVHEVEASRNGAKIGAPIIRTQLAPGVGVYSLGAGGDKLIVPVYTLGANVVLPADFKVTGEYAKIRVNGASEGLSRWGAYLALSKQIGAWTPYVYYAKMKSSDAALDKYRAINGNTLPPPFSALNNSQKLLADIVVPYDQSTIALGTSFRLTSNSLLKAEWSLVRSGVVSSFIDAPSGGDSANQRINVYSLAYSFTF